MSVLALSLTLNASDGFIATVSHTTSPQGAAAPTSLRPTPEAIQAALFSDLRQSSTSNDRARTVKLTSPKGTRTWSASSLTDSGLPSAAYRAYLGAAQTMAGIDPACQLPWTLLAGVGRIESDHGRYGGSVLGANGVSHPLIIGVALNGAGPVAAIPDTDGGRLDNDKVWDRAVGPMQFIPSTWANAARDGDGDGVESPNDIDDAALAAAAYLCSGSGSVLGETAMRAAIFRYNASKEYVALVMAMEQGYRTGVFIMPSSVVAQQPGDRPNRKNHPGRGHVKRGHRSAAKATSPAPSGKPSGGTSPSPSPSGGSSTPAGGGPRGGSSPSPTPSPSPDPGPSPSPSPSPSPTPSPTPDPKTEEKSGTLAPCGAGWCLDGWELDLGGDARLGQPASQDYDGDAANGETNRQEFEGLSGSHVAVVVKSGTSIVVEVQGLSYP